MVKNNLSELSYFELLQLGKAVSLLANKVESECRAEILSGKNPNMFKQQKLDKYNALSSKIYSTIENKITNEYFTN